jgi:tetratricopeptide (TPR) repeat protein
LAANSPEALRAYNNLAAALRDQGHLERARATMQEGIRAAERFGGGPMLRFLRHAKTIDDYFAGEWDEALISLEAFIAETEGSPHYQESGLRGGRALIRAARSDLEGAKADVERSLEASRAAADPQAVAPALGIAARVHYMAGDPGRARELGRELLELSRAYPSESQFVALLAPLAAPLGLEEELVELLDRAGPTDSHWLAVGRATVERRFLEAAEIYAGMPLRPDEAEARLRAAEQLLAEGRRVEANEQLRLAMDFWRSVGATWFIREAEKLLAATA